MAKYNFNNFGPQKFENLCQNLVSLIIGPGAKIYGLGKDGAREATFEGKANYPSEIDQWNGKWIFQAKYHDINHIGHKEARNSILKELDDELYKITEKYNHDCNNYILITNVSLTPVFKKGIKDRIDSNIVPKYSKKIKNIHVWGAEEVCNFLDIHTELRNTYSDLLITGDIIGKLIGVIDQKETILDEKVKLYCQSCFNYESSASLDDAGDMDDKKIELQKVFIDPEVGIISPSTIEINSMPNWLNEAHKSNDKETALSFILNDSIKKIVIVGGPGQGKSTLTQYISQVYRARLIRKLKELEPDKPYLESCIPRIPLRIILREFASSISDSSKVRSLFEYLSQDLSYVAGRDITTDDIHNIIKNNPIILIFDGLDEVPDIDLRNKVLEQINIFINQIENVYNSDYRIISTTRPQGYTDEFNPIQYLHLNLKNLTEVQAIDYATRWISEKESNPKEKSKIYSTFKYCIKDKIVHDLTKTPLQITILLVIIRAGSTPPKQREELYQTYMDTIYRREQKKSTSLITTDKNIIYGLHQFIGYILQKRTEKNKTEAFMNIKEFIDYVNDYLIFLNPHLDEEQLIDLSKKIITEARDRLVLIESPQEGRIGFSLTVMREFFAACHLVDTANSSNERNTRFESLAKSPYWWNVALFFAGRVGRKLMGEASSLIDICRLIDNDGEEKYLKRGAQLALDIVEDRALRVPYNEISAITYALTLLDNETIIFYENVINKLKEILNEYNKNVIKNWLIERINTVKKEKVKKYSRVYFELFGISDQLVYQMKYLSKEQDIKVEHWEIILIINNGVYENWILDILEKFINQNQRIRYSFFNEEVKWENVIPIFQLDLTDNIKEGLSLLLFDALLSFEDPEKEDAQVMKKNILNNLFDSKQIKENYLLPWAIYFTSEQCFYPVNNLNRIFFPYIFYPDFRESVIKNESFIQQFLILYQNTKNEFIKYFVQMFTYYLNPKDYMAYYNFYNNKYTDEFLEVVYYMFGENHQNKDHFNSVVQLFDYYNKDNLITNDIQELNILFNEVSNVNDQIKILYWMKNNGASILDNYLNESLLDKFKEWFLNKGLPYSVTNQFSIYNKDIDVEIVKMNIAILKEIIYKKKRNLTIDLYLLVNYSFKEEEDKHLLDDLNDLVNHMLIHFEDLNSKEKRLVGFALYTLLNNMKIDVHYIKEFYTLINNNVIKDNDWVIPYMVDSQNIEKKLKKFLTNSDYETSIGSAILLASYSSKKILYGWEIENFDSTIADIFFNYGLKHEGKVRNVLLGGIISCDINWDVYKDKLYELLLNSSKDYHLELNNIIKYTGLQKETDKEILLQFLIKILNNKNLFVYHTAALYRLNKEANISKIDENSLNLPLRKRLLSTY
jgi:hypothetical protein